MKALIIGATGATGKDLVKKLLENSHYKEVVVFVRSEIDLKHEKLQVHQIDFDATETWQHLVSGDVLFSCLGTTLSVAGSKEAQWKIDYGYQYEFAKSANANNVTNYVLISASNAAADSLFFYSKMKGQLEDAVKKLLFSKLVIVRPPILDRADSERRMEVLGVKVLRFFNNLGVLKSQKPMDTSQLAAAMIASVQKLPNGQHIIEGQEILELLT